MLTNPPASSDRNGLRIYADLITDKIREIRDNNLANCKKKKDEIAAVFADENNRMTLKALDTDVKDFELIGELEKRNTLRNSYALFDKVCKMISDMAIPLGKNTLKVDISAYKLNEIPPSIDIEDIATAWRYFFDDLHNARFIWSIILAMVIDIACFMFWYFGVLSKKDD